ncbi:hypothetical protein PtA15_10A679 [Puccinia triticina]|uniref:Uncharacterized protein n=1 Tax=Puccinia triticina TaxID=208348 RepID=A0ABY7CZP2_9BASI|nr:uncharacterized protein PtA15_10A679 [Puccinia triticina]WAQ89255.1 hypothetical protein PtA15_10A679 [Puccinia triticina]
MEIGKIPNMLSLHEYPLMKTYRDRRIPSTILIASILLFTGLIIFNLITQGKSDQSRTFISLNFIDERTRLHSKNTSGTKFSCDTSKVRLGDNIFMVHQNDQDKISEEDAFEAPESQNSPGVFQWTVYEINIADQNNVTEFRYSGQTLNCTIVFVKTIYQFFHHNYIYSTCGKCTYDDERTNKQIKITLCSSYDHSNAVMPAVSRGSQINLRDRVFHVLERLYPMLSINSSDLPLPAYPPDYNLSQEDLYRKNMIRRQDVSQLHIWLGGVVFSPRGNLKYEPTLTSQTIESPQGSVFLENMSDPGSYFEAFKQTDEKDPGSGFQISVIGVGEVRPFGLHEYNHASLPPIISQMFNYSYSISGLMMNLAADDLNSKVIGAHYLCNATRKEWQPFVKVFSTTMGSTMGVFGICFSIMLVVARRIDNFVNTHQESNRHSDSSENSTLHVEEGKDIPLKKVGK